MVRLATATLTFPASAPVEEADGPFLSDDTMDSRSTCIKESTSSVSF